MDSRSLASVALDGSLPDGYPVREVKQMKIKTTFYTRKKGVDFNPVIDIDYPKSRADQLSYQPTAKLIDQMVRTGQLVLAAKNQYDFPDGKDDGRSVPIDRVRGLDLPEISMALAESEQRLEGHKKNLKAMADMDEKKSANPVNEEKREESKEANEA